MLAGSLELATLVRKLPEQPGILDCQGRLRGEGPQEIHGLRRELSRCLPENRESAEQPVLPHERDSERCSVPSADEHLASLKRLGAITDVRHLDWFSHLRELPRR